MVMDEWFFFFFLVLEVLLSDGYCGGVFLLLLLLSLLLLLLISFVNGKYSEPVENLQFNSQFCIYCTNCLIPKTASETNKLPRHPVTI